MSEPEGEAFVAWLTDRLQRAGVLPHGAVLAVARGANPAFNSHIEHLAVTYTAEAPPTAPTRLLLKRSLPAAWAVAAGAREVAFYRLVAAHPTPLPMIVRCYAAEVDAADGVACLLLEDLSASHRPALERAQQLRPGENVPPLTRCERGVETLARFHAAWWGPARLGGEPELVHPERRDAAGWGRYMERRAAAWAALLAAEGEWLPDELRRLIDGALAGSATLWERRLARRLAALDRVTLTHGDAYFANVLYPDDPSGRLYLIDWQCPEVFLGPADLVPLLATFWTPAQRAADGLEARLLRHYHATLLAAGVADYPWEALLVDYRLALVEWLLVPLQDRADGAGRDYWWPKLQCLAGAYRDHRCAELLRS